VSGLLIRPARADELEELGALQRRASLAWGDHVAELLAMPEAGEVPVAHLPFTAVAEQGGRVAGFATLLTRRGAEAELEGLFVEPDLWRSGIGAMLVAETERRARAVGAKASHVVGNRRALGFYLRCGFEVVGETMTQLEPAPTLRRALA
jgi:N-acetylglutamate synthase-like GNAT family acetyltransferase